MILPGIPKDEPKRLDALLAYSILDTMPEPEYDDITYLASQICGTPISLISLVDDKRQWFKSHHGLDATETPRELAFCAHAINDKNNIFIVADSREDERFHDNPLVTDNPHVIFYAGIPLVNREGYALGTLCVIDNEPKFLNEFQLKALTALSNQIISLFELRKITSELQIKAFEAEAQNKVLEKFAGTAAHDIKSPLATIVMIANHIENQYSKNLGADGLKYIKMINTSADSLIHIIDGILNYSQNTKVLSEDKQQLNVWSLVRDIIKLVDPKRLVEFGYGFENHISIYTNKVALEQIFLNLLVNAIKYNDKKECRITIAMTDHGDFVMFNVIDNGPGIKREDQDRVLEIFETASLTDKSGDKGTGIGLATVKSLVEGLGGTIRLTSEIGLGTNFEFTIRK